MKIIRENYIPASFKSENDIVRFTFQVSVGRAETKIDGLIKFAEEIVKNKKNDFGFFNALTVFFWLISDPAGIVPAKASITYAPEGDWDKAFSVTPKDGFETFRYTVDFDNFCKTCWAT